MSRPKGRLEWLVPLDWEKCPHCRGRGVVRGIPPECGSCQGLGKRPTSWTLKVEGVEADALEGP